MLSTRTKSGLLETPKSSLSETSNNKSSPATPRVSKLGRTPSKTDPNSRSPLQNPRLSIDRSPKSGDPKPTIDRRSPKISTTTNVQRAISTPPDKKQRASKDSELQVQLDSLQEDLRRAKEKIASVEQEKVQSLEELKDMKRLADEANEKLNEALAAQKRAEDSSEIEKFRAVELEQAGIEASQLREEQWQKELESVRSHHDIDIAALISSTEELQRIKQELTMNIDAKNVALSHADDAMKIAEIHAEKVEVLSSEVSRLKTILEEKVESNASEVSEVVLSLNSEIDSLKEELQRAKVAEERVVDMKALIERLAGELDEAKRVEFELGNVVNEWKRKAELLETRVDELSQSERSALESLALKKKQLEETSEALQDAEAEIAFLKEKAGSLEVAIEHHRADLEESDRRIESSKQQVLEITRTIEVLESEIQNLQEEKMQAENNEKIAASNVQSLLEEKGKLLSNLDISRDEVGKNKTAMEGLASALHEVSSEARETKESLLIIQAELKNAESQIEELNSVLNDSKENYETRLEEAKDEINHLKNEIERSELETENLETKWNENERNFLSAIKASEDEIISTKRARDEATDSLKLVEAEVQAAKEDGAELLNKLKQAEFEAGSAKEATEEARSECLRLKERLLDKENELQNIIQENDELRSRESAALEKVKELTDLISEKSTKKVEENVEESWNGEKEHHLEENVGETETSKPESEHVKEHEEVSALAKEENRVIEDKEVDEEEQEQESIEVNTWENGKMVDKGLSPDREAEPESLEEEVDSKLDGDSFDHMHGLSSDTADNGGSSPSKQQQKKKNQMLRKLGSLLKKKSSPK